MVKGRMMKTETFLKTGEFARLCHTTKETLFHYDREGILRPRYVSENGIVAMVWNSILILI